MKLEEQQSRNAGQAISCRMGCAACCRMLVPLSPPEAFSLLEYIEQLPNERRTAVEGRLEASKAALAGHGLLHRLHAVAAADHPIPDEELEPLNRAYYALRHPCPFLEHEMCSIYEARPAACRELLVTSPAPLCDNLVENPVVPIPVSVRIGTVLGLLWAAVTGSAPRLIPLPIALDWARQHREAAGRRIHRNVKPLERRGCHRRIIENPPSIGQLHDDRPGPAPQVALPRASPHNATGKPVWRSRVTSSVC